MTGLVTARRRKRNPIVMNEEQRRVREPGDVGRCKRPDYLKYAVFMKEHYAQLPGFQ